MQQIRDDSEQIVLRDGTELPRDVYVLTRRIFVKASEALKGAYGAEQPKDAAQTFERFWEAYANEFDWDEGSIEEVCRRAFDTGRAEQAKDA